MKKLNLLFVVSSIVLSACSTSKKQHATAAIPKPIEEPIEVYACGFEQSTFEGVLPCFGNDCTDAGAPLTTLHFEKAKKIVRYLEAENGKRDSIIGTWTIAANCIVHIEFSNSKTEYFKYHADKQQLELLNATQQSFPGTLNKHYFISKAK